MPFKKILIPAGGVFLVAYAFYAYSWPGVAVALGGLVMWMLLHFTRMMHVLKRASNHPLGTVGSAVMLNAKLQPGVTLMHVVAMTKSLGALQSPKDTQPEMYRWTDGSDSHVTCEFSHGKLVKWELVRPTHPTQSLTESAAQTPGAAGDAAAP
jgi:hypothetical protein